MLSNVQNLDITACNNILDFISCMIIKNII